jgi:hypothetical protein
VDRELRDGTELPGRTARASALIAFSRSHDRWVFARRPAQRDAATEEAVANPNGEPAHGRGGRELSEDLDERSKLITRETPLERRLETRDPADVSEPTMCSSCISG